MCDLTGTTYHGLLSS